MSDEPKEALNTPAEEDVSNSTPPVEEPKATEEAKEEDQPTEVKSEEPRKGANQRIRQLNQRAKKAEEEADSLKERIDKMTAVQTTNQFKPIDNEPIVKDGEELTAAELESRLQQREKRILQQAAQSSQFEYQRQRAIDNIAKETNEVIDIYPQLNPDNKDHFDPDISEAITDATEAFIRSNPNKSVKQFVTRLMKPYGKSVKREVASQQKEIAKQAVETALRPSTTITKTPEKFEEKSILEMEKELGMIRA